MERLQDVLQLGRLWARERSVGHDDDDDDITTIKIIAVVSIRPCLTDKGEHTAL